MNYPGYLPFQRSSRHGFSIVELLTVVAFIAILGTLVGAGTGTKTGRQLEVAGLKATELLELARQHAMTRGAMAAVVLIKGDKSQVGIFELRARQDGTAPTNQDWIQLGRWEILPDGLVVDQQTLRPGTETFAAGPPVPSLHGKTVAPADFSYAIFLPSGQLMNSVPATLRLAAGRWDAAAGTGVANEMGSDGDPANYFKLTVIAATGRVKIDRR
jgi:Tfp pilus assembly protein FimT